MIRPAQLKLLERARVAAGPDPDHFPLVLQNWCGVDRVEDLAPAGYERLMDYLTWVGFRDKARPILSPNTRKLLQVMKVHLELSDFKFSTILRSYGCVGDLRDLTGRGPIKILSGLECHGLKVETFIALRREITPAQVRLLQVARKKTGMSDKHYSADLHDFGGVNSSVDLDRRGFDVMMIGMEVHGFERDRPPGLGSGFGRRPGFASPEQVDLIRALWREWIGPTGDSDATVEAGLNAWLERYHRASSLRFVTRGAAGKVITALRAMKARSPRKLHDDKEQNQSASSKI